MLKAMTTIEFCEKSMKRTGYDGQTYDRGIYGNLRSVLGEHPVLWLLPCSPPIGDGLVFTDEEAPLLKRCSKDVVKGDDIYEKAAESSTTLFPRKSTAGTGECSGSGRESDSEEGKSMVP